MHYVLMALTLIGATVHARALNDSAGRELSYTMVGETVVARLCEVGKGCARVGHPLDLATVERNMPAYREYVVRMLFRTVAQAMLAEDLSDQEIEARLGKKKSILENQTAPECFRVFVTLARDDGADFASASDLDEVLESFEIISRK